MDFTSNIIGITVGIRYARSFRLPDVSGEIIDEILYGSDTPFGIELYEVVQDPPSREKILSNTKTNEYLRINTDDLILGMKVTNDFDDRYSWLLSQAIPYLEEKVFAHYKIKNIVRIGVIFHHKLSKNKKLSGIASEITADHIKDAENVSVTFSKKLGTPAGTTKKGVNDYRNTIYAFSELRSTLIAEIDYQHYFVPMVEDLRDCKTKEVIENARKYVLESYYPWLSEYENKK